MKRTIPIVLYLAFLALLGLLGFTAAGAQTYIAPPPAIDPYDTSGGAGLPPTDQNVGGLGQGGGSSSEWLPKMIFKANPAFPDSALQPAPVPPTPTPTPL